MRIISLLIIPLINFSCAVGTTYVHDKEKPKAYISLKGINDSTGTNMRRSDILLFKNLDCDLLESGTNAGFIVENSTEHYTPSTIIPANKRLTVTFHYMDIKGSTNRSCDITGEFVPIENHKYTARVKILNNVKNCSLYFFDETKYNQQVQMFYPEHSCFVTGSSKKRGYKNGQPVHITTTYNVNVNVNAN